MVYKDLCILVLWMNVASAFEGLRASLWLLRYIFGHVGEGRGGVIKKYLTAISVVYLENS